MTRAERAVAEGHTEENPRALLLATGQPRLATLVRGSSRRITTVRSRPANIRVINRRVRLLGHRPFGSGSGLGCHRLRWRQGQARCARRYATLDAVLAGGFGQSSEGWT